MKGPCQRKKENLIFGIITKALLFYLKKFGKMAYVLAASIVIVARLLLQLRSND